MAPSRSALSRSDASGRARSSWIVRSSGMAPPSPAVPAIRIVPGPARAVRPTMRAIAPSAWIVPAMSDSRSPWPKSSNDAPASVAVPDGAGAASVPPTRPSSVSRPVARRPSPAKNGSSTARSSAPARRISSAPGPNGTRPCAVSVAVPACARASTCATPPPNCAVPMTDSGGACGAATARSPVACSRTVPAGAPGVPESLASIVTLPWPNSPGTRASAGPAACSRTVASSVGLSRPLTSSSVCRAPRRSRSTDTPPEIPPDAPPGR